MSRKLTGSKQLTATGWRASVPVSKGASQRRTCTFRTKADADQWLVAACAALETGRPLPQPTPSDLVAGSRQAAEGTPFKELRDAWADEYYGELHRGDVARETTVRGHIDRIDAFMRSRQLGIETMVRASVKELQASLTRSAAAEPRAHVPDGLDPEATVTLSEAVTLPAMASRSTLKRRIKDGVLRPVETPATGHRYRIADLYADAVVGADGTLRRGPKSNGSLSQAVANDVMWVFVQVCTYARDHGIHVPEDRESLRMHRTDRDPSPRRTPVSLTQCGTIAGHLHVVHQLVLWLMRCLGLRISEAFGIRVSDVTDFGPDRPGVIELREQGGRIFSTRQRNGVVTTGEGKPDLKTVQSRRALVAPPMLMDLIRVIIAVFHTDDAGCVRTDARLVPGLQRADAGGQLAFRTALSAGATAVGVDCSTDENRVDDVFSCQPHDMRRAVLSDLDRLKIKDSHIKRFAGQLAGPDVLHRHYLLDDPKLRAGREIADLLEAELRAEVPAGLLVPTFVRCTTGSQPNLAAEATRIDMALMEVGWLIAPSDSDGDPLLSVTEVALELGVTEKTARLWMTEGVVTSMLCPGGPRSGQRRSRLSDVVAVRDRLLAKTTLADIAEQVQQPYATVYQFARAQQLPLERWGERGYVVPDDVAEFLRSHYRGQAALHRRAVPLAVAATRLGITPAGIERLVKDGVLVEDERAHDRRRMVTRESVKAARAAVRSPRHSGPDSAGDAAPWAEAQALTGCSDAELDSLVAEGTLVLVIRLRRRHVTHQSLLRYLLDTAPELLRVTRPYELSSATRGARRAN